MNLLITINNLTLKFVPGNKVRLKFFRRFTNINIAKIGKEIPKYYPPRLEFQMRLIMIIKKRMQCRNRNRKHPSLDYKVPFTYIKEIIENGY